MYHGMNKRMIYEFADPKFVRTDNLVKYGSYDINLPKTYPFSPPTIKKHNQDIYCKLCQLFYKYKPFINEYHVNIECICCTTLCCTWSPCNKIMDVIKEINEYSYKMNTVRGCKDVFPHLPFDSNVNSCILQYLL